MSINAISHGDNLTSHKIIYFTLCDGTCTSKNFLQRIGFKPIRYLHEPLINHQNCTVCPKLYRTFTERSHSCILAFAKIQLFKFYVCLCSSWLDIIEFIRRHIFGLIKEIHAAFYRLSKTQKFRVKTKINPALSREELSDKISHPREKGLREEQWDLQGIPSTEEEGEERKKKAQWWMDKESNACGLGQSWGKRTLLQSAFWSQGLLSSFLVRIPGSCQAR